MSPRFTLLLAMASVGCEEPTCAEGGECADDPWQSTYLVRPWLGELTSEGTAGLALELPEVTGYQGMTSWALTLRSTNRSAETDCVVLVYLGDEPPDVSALWIPDPAEDPPAEVEGLGELFLVGNLTRVWDGVEAPTDLYWESEEGDWEGVALPRYASVVTCAAPDLEINVAVSGWWHNTEVSAPSWEELEAATRLW